MTNNDILRRVRYVFDFGDDKMIALFALAGATVTRTEVSAWLKKDDDPDYQSCGDEQLATFLNGLIIDKRGPSDKPMPPPESRLNNNLILRKLRIALNLSSEEVIEVIELAGIRVSKHELSALFRKPGHRQYRECLDQILRNFLTGLQLKLRPEQAGNGTL